MIGKASTCCCAKGKGIGSDSNNLKSNPSACQLSTPSSSYSSSADYSSVTVDSTSLTVTREEYRYTLDNDDDCVYCTTSHPNINLVLFLVAYVAFLVLGACLFSFIESPVQLSLKEQLNRRQQAFLLQHPTVDSESLNGLLDYVTSMQAKGVHWEPLPITRLAGPLLAPPRRVKRLSVPIPIPVAPHSQQEPSTSDSLFSSQPSLLDTQQQSQQQHAEQPATLLPSATSWEFTSSLLFVTSIVTTIGYGHVHPLTHMGKIACMLYSGVGIPLTLTFLSTMVILLVRGPAKSLESWLANFLLRICRNASIFFIRLLHLVTVTTILLCICFFLPAYAFSCLESDWSFLDALYYCFISLTTIGLGDFIPAMGSPNVQLAYRLITIVYLYFGLTMMMLWLALVYRIPQFNLNKLLISEEAKLNGDSNKPMAKFDKGVGLGGVKGRGEKEHFAASSNSNSSSCASLPSKCYSQVVSAQHKDYGTQSFITAKFTP